MNLDGLSTAAGAAAAPLATTHGPAAEAFHKGAEYDADTRDAPAEVIATAMREGADSMKQSSKKKGKSRVGKR